MTRFGNTSLSLVAAVLATASLLAGCGGGGGGSVSPTPASPATAAPTVGPQSATAKLVLSFPIAGRTAPTAKGRAPQYVSPNSTKVEVILNTVNGSAPPAGLTTDTTTPLVFAPAAGSNCTVSGGTATCTITVVAPPGTDNYTIEAENSSSQVLATQTQDITMTVGTNNTPSVTLHGVAALVNFTLPTLTANTSQSGATVTWSALDASGATIVGSATFYHPITVSDGDLTGQTTLHVNGGAASTTVTLTKPTDALTIDYTGQADNAFTLTASGTGISGSGSTAPVVFDVTFTGTTLDDAAHGGLSSDVDWSEPTLFFYQTSGSLNVTGAEVGWTNAPYSQQFDLVPGNGTGNTCGTGGSIATFSAGPATTFTITAHGVGICKVRLEEHGTGYPIATHPAPSGPTDTTHDGTFWISVSSSNVTVNGARRQR